jgi:uncharacterized protein (TIGR02646 family)
MIFIERKGFVPDTFWLAKADAITKQLLNTSTATERNKIIDENEAIWGELKNALMELSHDKCWYSESKNTFSYYHVDHFRPKKAAIGKDKKDYGGYWWLAFDWDNYRVCGAVGNVNKRDKFAVYGNKANRPNDVWQDETIYLLDPCKQLDPIKLTFNNNGEAMSLYSSGFHYEQAQYTIETLKLNFKNLKEARKKVWIDCSSLVNEISNLLDDENKKPSATRRGQIEEKFKQLKIFIKPTSEFSATARACLKSTGIEWAMNIAA